MTCPKVLNICVILSVIVFNSAKCSRNLYHSEIDIIGVQNITAFLGCHSERRVLIPLKKESFAKTTSGSNYLITYTLGEKRVRGDRQVATREYFRTCNFRRLVFDYPKDKNASSKTITFLKAIVEQSSPFGTAYVVYGGIGHRKITIIFEASQGAIFKIYTQIYGI